MDHRMELVGVERLDGEGQEEEGEEGKSGKGEEGEHCSVNKRRCSGDIDRHLSVMDREEGKEGEEGEDG